ncbi:hypothetical protein QJS10_CPA06g01182 [Acorus calamus]|uniref:Uncharacterized protein n=1 Tax=Acorus calamus TaxID=4465 RepID=A0AAV9EPR7_ACOCL|nr:hypothetical protein QJS10_CPA06g01182 [Acorus calamus]
MVTLLGVGWVDLSWQQVLYSDKDSNAGSVAEPKLSAPSIARPSVFSPPHFRSTVDSTARFFSNRSDDHLAGGATNFMLQSCTTNVMPSRSTDWTGIRGGGHGGLHSPIDDDDEHTHD